MVVVLLLLLLLMMMTMLLLHAWLPLRFGNEMVLYLLLLSLLLEVLTKGKLV